VSSNAYKLLVFFKGYVLADKPPSPLPPAFATLRRPETTAACPHQEVRMRRMIVLNTLKRNTD